MKFKGKKKNPEKCVCKEKHYIKINYSFLSPGLSCLIEAKGSGSDPTLGYTVWPQGLHVLTFLLGSRRPTHKPFSQHPWHRMRG